MRSIQPVKIKSGQVYFLNDTANPPPLARPATRTDSAYDTSYKLASETFAGNLSLVSYWSWYFLPKKKRLLSPPAPPYILLAVPLSTRLPKYTPFWALLTYWKRELLTLRGFQNMDGKFRLLWS